MSDYADNLLDAISMVVQHALTEADFDKTIQAVILSCEDEVSGLYKVRYQDSVWLARSSNLETTFPAGTLVYVLIPGNDMSRSKTIIGAVSSLGEDYVDYVDSKQAYIENGIGIIAENTAENGLCSYKTQERELTLNIDTAAAVEYLKGSDYILIQGDFRTQLPQINNLVGIMELMCIWNLKIQKIHSNL